MKSLFGFLSVLTLTTAALALEPPPLANPVSPEIIAKHRAMVSGQCEAEQEANATAYDLTPTVKLVMVPCFMGAYQGSARAYLTYGSGAELSLEPIALLSMEGKTIVATLDLGDGDFDSKTNTIYTHAKGRGIGDCGQSSQSKVSVDQYGSVSIKTVKINSKDKCDGKMTAWPLVFSQK